MFTWPLYNTLDQYYIKNIWNDIKNILNGSELRVNSLNLGVSQPHYNLRMNSSIVYEIALDIASYTWEPVHDKLASGITGIHEKQRRMSQNLREEVKASAMNHSWRCVLNLAHRCETLQDAAKAHHLEHFVEYIHSLRNRIRHVAAPYLEDSLEPVLSQALDGDATAQTRLLTYSSENPLVHDNLTYLFSVSGADLASHIEKLVRGWYAEILPDVDEYIAILEKSCQETMAIASECKESELIKQITRGGELTPEPGVRTLWLIPQISYRPFTIRNRNEDCSIYYYPVSERLISKVAEHEQLLKLAELYKAAGDPQRLKLLKLLASDSKSLADCALAISSSKPATHHHLLLLRTAGLVSVESGVYSVNWEGVQELGNPLLTFLGMSKDGVGLSK